VSRFELWLIHLSTALVGGTGLIYAWMLWGMESADPFAVVNHPWQPAIQHLHVWTAPLLVFAAGMIWRAHVWEHWTRGVRARRRSGIGLVLTLVPMVASGYLIQTAVSDGWRTAWVAVHLTTSVFWLTGYLVHQFSSRSAARNGAPKLSTGSAGATPSPLRPAS
jgi:hypothetical protein